jgi:hypothetical protein
MDDPEAFLRNKALELHRDTKIVKSRNHLGFLTEIYIDGTANWGELFTDEPLEHRDQYLEWAQTLADKLPLGKVLALGYSYSVLNVLCLFHIKPRGVLGESVRVVEGRFQGEWYRNVVPDPFAQVLWAILRKEG